MQGSGMSVLLVEDDKQLGDMIKKALRVEGYKVDWVQDGLLALKNLSEKDYDLVLLDLMLPSFDGIKICKKVRESKEFPSVWTNIHTYSRFKATRRGLRASMSPGSTLSPHNLSERLANTLRAYFFGGFLSFPTWDKNKYSTPHPVVKEKK